jgi:hypothetical protein
LRHCRLNRYRLYGVRDGAMVKIVEALEIAIGILIGVGAPCWDIPQQSMTVTVAVANALVSLRRVNRQKNAITEHGLQAFDGAVFVSVGAG